jgi:SAM-dependent methyltransferase
VRWIAKGIVQRLLSGLPGGERGNYALQRWVTRQLPRSDEHFRLHAAETIRHFDSFARHGSTDPAAARFYEFGAGWDLINPIVYFGLGVEHQTLVDIRPNLRFEQVGHTIEQYKRLRADLERAQGHRLRPLDGSPVRSLEDLEQRFGIVYLAPRDARSCGLPDDSFDFVSSTFTLEHIPAADIAAILAECRRILKPGGLVSSSIDMQDHYSFFDPSITAFNFLKFSDRRWSLVNSSLHYQNRLREPDHRELHEGAGLSVIEASYREPPPEDLDVVRRLRLAPRFRSGYTDEQLAIREVSILARKEPMAEIASGPEVMP